MTTSTAYTGLIQQVAQACSLDPDLLEAQCVHESSGHADAFRWEPAFFERYIQTNPRALAKAFGPLAACSYGLLQIMLETAMERGYTDRPEQLFVARIGLTWGAKQLQYLLALASGDYPLALGRYNGGPAVRRPFGPVIQSYVSAVYQIAGRPVPEVTP